VGACLANGLEFYMWHIDELHTAPEAFTWITHCANHAGPPPFS